MRYKDKIKEQVAQIEELTGKKFKCIGSNGEYSVYEKGGSTSAMPYASWYRKPKDLSLYLDGVIDGLKMK